MPTASQMIPRQSQALAANRRPLDLITGPLNDIARHSSSLTVCEPGRFELGGQAFDLPRYLFVGPQGGDEPIRLGLFAGIHGDEPASVFGLLRLVQLLEQHPDIARGYCLFLYPVCNPTGFVDRTRHNLNGRDLNREFWRESDQPEIRLLQSELWSHAFHGLISLHTDDTSDGLYGYAHGPLLTQQLLAPAIAAAKKFLPMNHSEVIDGFPARDGIIRDSFEGILRAPPGLQPRPFEIIFETPHQAPQYMQEAAFAVAVRTILEEYRQFIAYAQNL
jgi:murein peptide amidase A